MSAPHTGALLARTLAAVSALLVLTGCASLQATCPFSLTPQSRQTVAGSEHWCETHRALREGPYERRDASGRIAERGEFQRDRRSGTWIEYDTSGRRAAERPYVDGTVSGEVLRWHGSGALASRTAFFDGVAQGVVTRWDEDGDVELEGRYCAGRACGEWQWYGEDGARVAPHALPVPESGAR
jgi:hypothetical protein